MGFMDKAKDAARSIGQAAGDFAKTAGDKAQDLAQAAKEKTAYLKEVSALKNAIRDQKGVVAASKMAIAERMLELLDAGEANIPDDIRDLGAKVKDALAQITALEGQIEELKAAAAAKNPEMEQELSKAIAEIDREQAVDIPAEQAPTETPAEPAAEPPAETAAAADTPAEEKPAE